VAEGLSLAEQTDAFERALIERHLVESGGRIAVVMARLNIPRRTLSEKMARHGLDRRDYAASDRQETANDSAKTGGNPPKRGGERPRT
jgi:two-component system C4-dicarboxylate transport response regulator DctD